MDLSASVEIARWLIYSLITLCFPDKVKFVNGVHSLSSSRFEIKSTVQGTHSCHSHQLTTNLSSNDVDGVDSMD